MANVLYVISDLHLGGTAPSKESPGFQMCSAEGRSMLRLFIRHITEQQRADCTQELIINGDFIDFLAEEPFESFSASEDVALAKLNRIFSDESAAKVLDELKDMVRTGVQLTINLGNHDLELCLPRVQRALIERLGNNRIELVDDNQALVRGPVLIEHGNRYDGWNRVDHDRLRQLRSQLSRREPPQQTFKPPAGSELVVEVMNDIKRDYPFIDLLKPETDAALPLLAVLAPQKVARLSNLREYLKDQLRAFIVGRSIADGRPRDPGLISSRMAGSIGSSGVPPVSVAEKQQAVVLARMEAALRMAHESAYGFDEGQAGNIGARGTMLGSWSALRAMLSPGSPERGKKFAELHSALRRFAQNSPQVLDTDWEADDYLTAAESAAQRGFHVVVYGHTHLLKRVSLKNGGVYLNTGTWADLIAFPRDVLSNDKARAEVALAALVADLVNNQLSNRRCLIPSYARIEYGESSASAALQIFRSKEHQDIVTKPTSIEALHRQYGA